MPHESHKPDPRDEQIATLVDTLWQVYRLVGADTDGDPTPAPMIAGMGVEGYARAILDEVRGHCQTDNEGDHETAALKAKLDAVRALSESIDTETTEAWNGAIVDQLEAILAGSDAGQA